MTGSRPSSYALMQPGPLRLFNTAELLRLPAPTWLIQDILPAGGLAGIYGPPGTGKSFLAIDMALAVATNRPWHDHAVEPGFVLYVSAEGGTGIGKRAGAWLQTYEVDAQIAQVGWLTEAVEVNPDSDSMAMLLERIQEELNVVPSFVIIDTLARCFDGDENQQEDMGRFIGGVDKLRRELNATVLVVHHTRLDGERERGNTAFRGAADTMCAIHRKPKSDAILLTCNKQKDAEEFGDHQFLLKTVPSFQSCVIIDEVSTREEVILKALVNGPLSFTELKGLTKVHISPATLKRGLVSLKEKREITKKNGIYQLAMAHVKNSEP